MSKVIQINVTYNNGSTGKITHDIHTYLTNNGVESVVLYGRGKRVKGKNIVKVGFELPAKINKFKSLFTGNQYGYGFFATKRVIKLLAKEKPTVVHLQCLNGYFINIYKLIEWLNRNKVKTVLTLHAEFMHTANCDHSYDCKQWITGCQNCPDYHYATGSFLRNYTVKSWKRMKKAFEGFDSLTVVPVSNWLKSRVERSPFFNSHSIITIHNGIDISCFDYVKKDTDTEVLTKYNIPLDKKIVLHVTPSFDNPMKGGEYFVELSKMFGDEYIFVVVGLSDKSFASIIHIPFTNNQRDLAVIYRSAAVLVICSKIDNYPTVCLEANCCGTPVVGFDVGGVSETIFPKMGETVSFGNILQMKTAVEKWAATDIDEQYIENCRAKNSKERMSSEYMSIYGLEKEKNDVRKEE